MGPLQTVSVDKPHGIRAVGIVIHQERILLIRRVHHERIYFTFPGGGVEVGDTVENTVIQEINEETSMHIAISRLVYHHDLIGDSDHFFYACHYLSGTPTLGGEELEATKRGNVHEPLWMPLSVLPTLTLYPLEVRDWVIEDAVQGFPTEPRLLTLRPDELRNA